MKWHLLITVLLAAIMLVTFACGERAGTDDSDSDAEDINDDAADDDSDDDANDDLGDDDTEMSDDEIQALCEEFFQSSTRCDFWDDMFNPCIYRFDAECVANVYTEYGESIQNNCSAIHEILYANECFLDT